MKHCETHITSLSFKWVCLCIVLVSTPRSTHYAITCNCTNLPFDWGRSLEDESIMEETVMRIVADSWAIPTSAGILEVCRFLSLRCEIRIVVVDHTSLHRSILVPWLRRTTYGCCLLSWIRIILRKFWLRLAILEVKLSQKLNMCSNSLRVWQGLWISSGL